MVPAAFAGSVAASIKALGAGMCLVWQRLAAVPRRGQRREYEPLLADSVDRFELERREQAWMRWQSSDASLLGR